MFHLIASSDKSMDTKELVEGVFNNLKRAVNVPRLCLSEYLQLPVGSEY